MANRAKKICAGIKNLHDEAVVLAESVENMAERLRVFNEDMPNQPLITEYDNGGNQTGTHENPYFVAYEHLLAAYNKALRQLSELVKNGTPTKKATNIMKELSVISGKRAG